MNAQVKPGYKLTEVGVIPDDWECTDVNSVAALVRNAIVGGPFGSDLVSRDYVDDGTPVIRGQNMGQQWLEAPYVFVSKKKALSLEANLARPGDVVFTQRGTVGQVSLVPDAPYKQYLISQSQMKVTLNRDIFDSGFFYCWFSSEGGQASIRQNTIQTGVPHINLGILRSIPIPKPPLAEQRIIATALFDMSKLINGLDELIAKKRDIKQATMQQLLTSQQRLPGFSGKWEMKRLGDLAKIQRGASPRPIDSPIWFDDGSSVGWVRISDVTRSNIYLRETTQRLSPLGVKHSRPVCRGSLIMSICATVGRPVITEIDTCIHDGFVVFDDLETSKHFMYYALKFIEGKWSRHGQTGSQMNLNTGLIKNTEVYVPPREEQTAIANLLKDMDSELTALETRHYKARKIKQGMMQELLTGKIRIS